MTSWEGCEIGRHRSEAPPRSQNIARLAGLSLAMALVLAGYVTLLVWVFG